MRHVEVTPKLRDVLLAHRAEKIRRGYPVEPDKPFFCTRKGTRWDDGNVRERVLDAGAQLASGNLVQSGLPPLPHVTPHTMRRTYVSIMLLATNFDVGFVQSQVGHSDSKLTVDVYNELLDRSKRAHGVAFDALVSDAQTTLYGARRTAILAHYLAHQAILARRRTFSRHRRSAWIQGKRTMGAGGIEPPTSRV